MRKAVNFLKYGGSKRSKYVTINGITYLKCKIDKTHPRNNVGSFCNKIKMLFVACFNYVLSVGKKGIDK